MNIPRWVIMTVLLIGAPVACTAGCVASQKVACHAPRTYDSGNHLGYRIGMTRAAAVEASAPFLVHRRAIAIWDRDEIPPEISTPRHNERFVRTLGDLRAPGWNNEEWLITHGASWCLLSESDTRLVFRGGRLRTISDELGYNGP